MDLPKAGKKRVKGVLRVLGILLLVGLLIYALLVGWVVFAQAHLPKVGQTDAIVVLGAQVKADGSPSRILERRLRLALEQYEKSPQIIITCGAQGDDEPAPEGDVMRAWLIDHGVDPAHVIAETSSFNTRQNLQFARQIMENEGFSMPLIVTSDYHVARALALCKSEGIENAVGVGSETEPLYWVKNYGREALSWVKFWLEGWFS